MDVIKPNRKELNKFVLAIGLFAALQCFSKAQANVIEQAQSSPLVYIEGPITIEQRKMLSAQFTQTYKTLPPQMKVRIEKRFPSKRYNIRVDFFDPKIAGEVNAKGNIELNFRILSDQKLLERTLIHEFAHIYDQLQFIPDDIAKALMICDGWGYSSYPPEYCELYHGIESSISTLPGFLDASGLYQSFQGHGERIKETTFGYRSPDVYESKNSREMFAVNMEYYLTDPEYQCRRPSIYRYLSNYFSYHPFGQKSCPQGLSFVDPHFGNAKNAIKNIDLSKVYQIHYLLAGAGSGTSASFGHSMVRVVICSPQREKVGPECLKDIEHHLVLSFRGFVDQPQNSALSGLLGKYPSRLFFLPLPQVINEYNIVQLRDLYSYPLKLSQQEIKNFLERAVETHWSYKNQYYFLTNNCALETMNLLKAGISRKQIQNSRPQTPQGLLEELIKKDLIDSNLDLRNLPLAKENGFFFQSNSIHLKEALDIINKEAQSNFDISEWFNLKASDRREIYKGKSSAPLALTQKWPASFLFLERYIEKWFDDQIYQNLIENTLNEEDLKIQKDLLKNISRTFNIDGQLTSPSNLTQSGYGIPSPVELAKVQIFLSSIEKERDKNQSEIDSMMNLLRQKFGQNEVNSIHDNLRLFYQGLSSVPSKKNHLGY